jgi:eukaryotic-like serine/threonine-protein kinase
MDRERYKRVDQILQEALSHSPDSLESFLEKACAGDDDLRREVASLIAHERQAGSLMNPPVPLAIVAHQAEEQDFSGHTLSHYRIVKKIGEGGMGVVYRAEDVRLKRTVAVKILPADRVSDAQRKRRFVKEARAASALKHPNIVTIYEIDQTEGVDFIVMEYVAGQTLDRQIPRKGMPSGRVLELGIQMADALAAAHSAGVIHRDLKPSNVIVSDSGQAKILDFGLAKLVERAEVDPQGDSPADMPESSLHTGEGMILGTVAYMSPEQAQGKKVDARSDIFSFGAVLYEMVTGRRAFEGDSAASTLAAIVRDEPKPLCEIVPAVPADFDKVIRRCLRKDPDRRFQAISDVRVELQEVKEELESGLETDQPPSGARKPLWIAAAAVLIGLLVVAAWWLLRPGGESRPVLIAVPFTTYPGGEVQPTFSPDGNQVAFHWSGEKQDNWDIYVKSVGSEKPLRLTSDPAPEVNASWSPDGSHIAFLRFKDNRFAVYSVPPLGGAERKVYETTYVLKPWINGRLLTHTPDSNGFVISERASPDDPNALMLVRLDTGEKVRLTAPPAGFVGDCDPAFSPDGRILTFIRVRAIGSFSDLYRIDLSLDFRPVGEPKTLTDRMPVRFRHFVGHAWSGNGREIIASLERGIGYDFWRISLDDPRRSRRLEFAGQGGVFPAISRSARRMVYVNRQPGPTSTWYLEDSGASTKQAVRTRLFGSSTYETHCRVSPDGEKIAFQSGRSGFMEICTSNSDGSGFLRLTNYNGPHCGSPAWAPDSRSIAYDGRPEGQSEIYVISSEGGQPRRVTNHPADDIMPTWSRNGRWIYFTSNRSGQWQVWKTPSEGGPAIQITHKGGWYAQESLDGKILFFGKPFARAPYVSGVPYAGHPGVYRRPVVGGEEAMFLSDANIEMFAETSKGYYFWTTDRALTFLDSSTGAKRIVAVTDKFPRYYVSVFPDGKRIVYTEGEPGSTDLYLVENFR